MGATTSLTAIFLPGLLIVAAALPFWKTLSARERIARMLTGVNAAVVGVLAAALYNPLWTSAVQDSKDFAIALVGFVFLAGARWPAWIVALWCVFASLARSPLKGFALTLKRRAIKPSMRLSRNNSNNCNAEIS